LEIQTDQALLGGVEPAFVVDMTSGGAACRSANGRSSLDELVTAFRNAATYKSPIAALVVWIVIAAIVSLATFPMLLIVVLAGGIALLTWASARDRIRKRVAVVYHLDPAANLAFESLGNGVGWIGSSNAAWRVGDSGARAQLQAFRGDVPNVLTQRRKQRGSSPTPCAESRRRQ
jgi:hypothetical protein